MQAIQVDPITFPKIEEYLKDAGAMARLKVWYYGMIGVTRGPFFYVTPRILENGDKVPGRLMPWTRLTTDFEGAWVKYEWFDISPKTGAEMWV